MATNSGLPAVALRGCGGGGCFTSAERILATDGPPITIHSPLITAFLIATHAKLEIATTHSQHGTSYFLIATKITFPQSLQLSYLRQHDSLLRLVLPLLVLIRNLALLVGFKE